MDIGKAFTFFYEDEKWLEKIGIGIGLVIFSFLILPTIILSGYAIRLLKNVRDGHEKPLPEWDDWSGDLVRGFKFWVVGIVWSLPMFLFMIPMTIGAAVADTGGPGEFVGISLALCASCLMFLYGLFMMLAQPGYTIAFAKDDRIGSGLALTNIWGWTQANLGQVIIAALVVIAAAFIIMAVAGIAGLILCGVGLFLTIPLATVVMALFPYHLYGQLANEYPMYGSPVDAEPVAPAPVVPAAAVPGEEIEASSPVAEEAAEDDLADETVAAVPVAEEVDEVAEEAPVETADIVEETVEIPVDEAPVDGEPAVDAPVEDADASADDGDEKPSAA